MSLSSSELVDYLIAQLRTFFPDKKEIRKSDIGKHIDRSLQRTEYCFSKVNNRYFREGKNVLFNHLNADHYAMLLYFVSNTLYKNSADPSLCVKVFQLNRYLHGIDIFYEVDLPEIFLFVHPLGTVLGRAVYSDYLLVYQRCSIGSNKDIYPSLGKYLSLHPGASIMGSCSTGENCKISTGSTLIDRNLENNTIYIGNTLASEIKTSLKKPAIWEP